MMNTYFAEMERIGKEYEEEKAKWEQEKKDILKEKGWDSEEYKAWKESNKEIEFPFTGGQMKAYRACRHSEEQGLENVIMDDFLWDKEVTDFADTLRAAGIERFIYTNQSTAVMENIHGLIANGCKMEGPVTFEKDSWMGKETILGLAFTTR
ncbi:hypothetical protein [Eubacterium sp. AB3007]|uniref:DUF7698 family protein n=1 Tax=Eubacterium sp. AB3007 TaxID=1392487 RepID=UPI000484125A|nr:hypothetical protein [Eubacterium sp. AB3007]